MGADRRYFEDAIRLAQQKNLTLVDAPMKRVVVYLNAEEFKSTWLGNKSVYRTRMAIADGGELIVLAPGADKFGEDAAVDKLIRRYGYTLAQAGRHVGLTDVNYISRIFKRYYGMTVTEYKRSLERQQISGGTYDV